MRGVTLRRMAGALYHRINRPYYVFRPSQLWRRLRLSALEQRSVARLPWGLEIEFNTAESIGNRLATNGVLDLEVTERCSDSSSPAKSPSMLARISAI
jgi:hypothetical protein